MAHPLRTAKRRISIKLKIALQTQCDFNISAYSVKLSEAVGANSAPQLALSSADVVSARSALEKVI